MPKKGSRARDRARLSIDRIYLPAFPHIFPPIFFCKRVPGPQSKALRHGKALAVLSAPGAWHSPDDASLPVGPRHLV